MALIYLDACLLTYLVERDPRWCDQVAGALEDAGDVSFGISPLTECECLVAPLRREDRRLRRAYESVFGRFLSLDMPRDVYLEAAELRAAFGLKTPDALHLACARHHNCVALWTNDDRLLRAGGKLARNVLT